MDKPKPALGRGGKSKTPQFPSDLYVLGPKGARTEANEPRRPVPVPVPVTAKATSSHSLADRRRLSSATAGSSSMASSVAPPSKKPKLASGVLSRPNPFLPPTASQEPGKSWEHIAIDVEPIDLVPTVMEAKEKNENEKITALICGALRQLKASKVKADTTLMNGLLFLAKKYPSIFTKENVMTASCSILRRESSLMYKVKTTYSNAVLLVNILFFGHQNIDQWPDIFLKMYIEDSLGERLWVDSDQCKCFVDNIICSVNTTPSHDFDLDTGARVDSDDGIMSIIGEEHKPYLVINRYKGAEENVENIVMDAIKDQLNRRQATEGISKHFLKFLCSMCGITEVRAMVASKLEVWLTNPKLKNNAKELLMTLCVNCTSNTPRDIEIVASIVKIKLKVKDLHVFYLACIKELIPAHDNNLSTVLRQIVNNELAAARNQNYVPMLMFNTLYQADPEQFASILAKIFLEYLMNREDNLRSLRSILREVSKVLRTDLDLIAFVRGLLKQREPFAADAEIKEHVFRCITDLVCVCAFLAASLYARVERKDITQVEKTQMLVANIQCYAIKRFYKNAFHAFRSPEKDFKMCLRKVVFLEPPERYYEIDNWPSEQDRALYMRLAIDVPLMQKTVIYLLQMGLSKEYPISCAEVLEIVEQLVVRASSLTFSLNIPVLPADDLEMIDLMFSISAYRQPESTELPAGYVPPNLAVSSLYWKVWIILLIYCAHVPHIFGVLAWDKYPTLRMLIEMCITNNFVPPATPADELQVIALEKQKLIEYETYLAKGTITENTSFLLSLVVTMDPFGIPRRPTPNVLDQLQQLNATHKLGQLLCRSRNPDFLLDIIRKQGSSQSMPWLADLVQNSESSFDHLPVQCLCEFLLSTRDRQGRYQQLLQHLQVLLTDEKRDPNVACEILDHFLRRFSSHANKEQAIFGLKLLLVSNEKEMETDNQSSSYGEVSTWILNELPAIPHFSTARPQIVRALREACQVENDPELITSYLTFLSQHVLPTNTDLREMTELVLDMAQLIVERSTIMAAVLPTSNEDDSASNIALTALLKIFYTYLMKAREAHAEEYTWPESQEQILVTWPSGEKATLYILVVHAIIILLTYERRRTDRVYLYWDSLLNMWFPEQKELTPKAYLVDTKEEALLIPDWLKLRMIRSEVPRLIEEALTDLEPAQLLLFIQSFGIPVNSMSILLQTLDIAIRTERISIPDVAIDKTYMIQLVEVQHNRNAVGGTLFANTVRDLDAEGPVTDSPPALSPIVPKTEPFDDERIPSTSKTSINDVELDQIIEHMSRSAKPVASPRYIEEIQQKLLYILSSELSRCAEIASKHSTTVTLKKVINKLLRKCSADSKYVSNLVRNFRYACKLFRLLTTSRNEKHVGPLAVIAKTILECKVAVESPKNPLVVTLKTFLNENNYSEITAKLTKPDPDAKNVLDAFENCSIDQLERTGTNLMESAMRKTHGAKTVIEAVSGLITRSDKKFKNASGLFIDWLVQIEPEILGSTLDLQMDMLFSLKEDTKWESLQICRPYLLTLLTHHASWFTLKKALAKLLTLKATKKYDATAVLEFLWAVARNPRLWQGRELISPKHQRPEDVLDLNESELICVIEYIVMETEVIGFNERGFSRMSHRLSQLVECAIDVRNNRILMTIIEHLSKESAISDSRKQICQNVIAHLYLRIPRIINLLNEMQVNIEFDFVSKAARDSSILDIMSHTVLTSLTTNSQIKDSPKRTQELELILRKMSSTHPRLVLRQIKIIETSLLGRIHLEWPVFRNRNFPSFFQQVFGILELLQPHLFAAEFSASFHSILDVYLNLFKAHGSWKDIDLLMPRYVVMAHNYNNHDHRQAISYLQSRSALIKEMAIEYPCLGNLCVLMVGEPDASKDKEIMVPTPSTLEVDSAQWDEIINSFVRRDSEAALAGLEHASVRKPMLLEPLLERLFPFLLDDSSFNRSLAHMLLARCLKYNPKMSSRVLQAVFDCLHSERPSVVESACNSLPELIICCQENAVPLLKKLFAAAVREGINTIPCISRTISLINLQSSY